MLIGASSVDHCLHLHQPQPAEIYVYLLKYILLYIIIKVYNCIDNINYIHIYTYIRDSMFVQMENQSIIYLDLGDIEVDYNALLTFTSQK